MRNTRRSTHTPCRYDNNPQDAQKGRPARPQQATRRIVLAPYGEPLSAARTPLADFFRILLGSSLEHVRQMGEGREGRRLILLPAWRRFIRRISGLIPLVLIVVTVETE